MMDESRAAVRVAVLDDQATMRECLEQALSGAGYDVVGSASPETFLSTIAEREPAVAMIDLALGDGARDEAGFDVLRTVRERYPGVRTVVLSSSYDGDRLRRALAEGARAYLWKTDAGYQQIVSTIDRVLSGEQMLTSASIPPAQTVAQGAGERAPPLTPREREVLSLVTRGDDNLQIAAQLGITERTVRAHMGSLYRKFGSENRTVLAITAREFGIHPPSESSSERV